MTAEPLSRSDASPVTVNGSLDGELSRWLWLVKWLLAIPHYIVLFFLWLVFAVFSVIAFFAILFTGRYPRALFDFNVGVIRWSWRVAFYAYGALGTDRYPPFSLQDVPDYPAHVEIEYPERLSRGLVLVKWWLLAIPQYLIVAIFTGGGLWATQPSDHGAGTWTGGGLIGLLVLFVGISLLFRNRYPRGLFDLVLGLDRWVVRVAAYAALMTDVYPPFRLDQGGTDPQPSGTPPAPYSGSYPAVSSPPPVPPQVPAPPQVTVPPQAPYPPPPPSGPASGWSSGRVIGVVVGVVVGLLGLGLGTAGGAALVAGHTLRDADGFLTSPVRQFTTSGSAVTTNPLIVHDAGGPDAVYVRRLLGDVRIRVTPTQPARRIFVGIAPTSAVHHYLAGVRYVRIDNVGDPSLPLVVHGGSTQVRPPQTQSFWTNAEVGRGPQSMQWKVRDGSWTVVVMNASARPGLSFGADVGATLPALQTISIVLAVVGLILLGIGALIVGLVVNGAHRAAQACRSAQGIRPSVV